MILIQIGIINLKIYTCNFRGSRLQGGEKILRLLFCCWVNLIILHTAKIDDPSVLMPIGISRLDKRQNRTIGQVLISHTRLNLPHETYRLTTEMEEIRNEKSIREFSHTSYYLFLKRKKAFYYTECNVTTSHSSNMLIYFF